MTFIINQSNLSLPDSESSPSCFYGAFQLGEVPLRWKLQRSSAHDLHTMGRCQTFIR